MFYELLNVICSFLYGSTPATTTYEYMLAVVLAGVGVVLALYIPFAVVRWIFRGAF